MTGGFFMKHSLTEAHPPFSNAAHQTSIMVVYYVVQKCYTTFSNNISPVNIVKVYSQRGLLNDFSAIWYRDYGGDRGAQDVSNRT
jgi:hypothetical protein